MHHIFINFLPGSAGNFLSRFLQCALDEGYCWTDSNGVSPETFQDKIDLLSYKNINKNWVDFENRLTLFDGFESICNEQPVPIHLSHCCILNEQKQRHEGIIGPDDAHTFIQITYDNKKDFEWIILNAFYKDSYVQKEWFELYQSNLKETNIIKFPVSNFQNWDTFKQDIIEILDYEKLNYNPNDIELLEDFYNEWFNTSLKEHEFDQFKEQIGWIL